MKQNFHVYINPNFDTVQLQYLYANDYKRENTQKRVKFTIILEKEII